MTTSDNDGTYVLVRNEVGHLVKHWLPPTPPEEAIQRAYVQALGEPAPDSWRESLAALVHAAQIARQTLANISQAVQAARATPYQPGKWAETCTAIAVQADAAAAPNGDGLASQLAQQLANLQLRLDLVNKAADEYSEGRDRWLRQARESERQLHTVQAERDDWKRKAESIAQDRDEVNIALHGYQMLVGSIADELGVVPAEACAAIEAVMADAAAMRGAIRAWHGDIVAAQWPKGLIGPKTQAMLDAAAAEHPGSDLLVIAAAARSYQQAVQGLDGVQAAEAALFAALDAAAKRSNGHG